MATSIIISLRKHSPQVSIWKANPPVLSVNLKCPSLSSTSIASNEIRRDFIFSARFISLEVNDYLSPVNLGVRDMKGGSGKQ